MTARPPFATRPVLAVAAAFGVVLLAAAGGYGYHRDELYFIALGGRPAAGYVDQPPLVPLLDHAVDALGGHSLVLLRLPAALAGAAVVVLTALIARELGTSARVQLLAAATVAVSAYVVDVAHIASTSVFDLLAWSALTWLWLRACRVGRWAWVVAGAVLGLALETKSLVALLVVAVGVGVLVVGPRRVLRSPWLWAGLVLAAGLAAPDLLWQATHGWPQLTLSSRIAAGSSGTSQPRWLVVPYQALLISPVLVPVWVAGLWHLLRAPSARPYRFLGVAYLVLLALVLVTGGKPYYVCGLYPALLAAGADPTLRWVRRGAGRWRAAVLGVALGLTAVVSAVLMLPLVPVASLHATPVVAINNDAGETVGWPRDVATVRQVWRDLPAAERSQAVVLTGNYGEAGALMHYAPDLPVFSGHNGLWDLGPPPAGTRTAVIVTAGRLDLSRWFTACHRVTTLSNGVDVDDEEQGASVAVCNGPRAAWAELWPELRRLG